MWRRESINQFVIFLLLVLPLLIWFFLPMTNELRAYVCGEFDQQSLIIRIYKLNGILLDMALVLPVFALYNKTHLGKMTEDKWIFFAILWALSCAISYTNWGKPQSACREWENLDRMILSEVMVEMDSFYKDCGFFPTAEQGLDALVHAPTLQPICAKWQGPYFKKTPTDKWNRPFIYERRMLYPLITTLGRDGQPGGANADSDLNSDQVRSEK